MASSASRSVARRHMQVQERRKRRRHERLFRFLKRFAQYAAFVRSEGRLWLIAGTIIVAITVASFLLFAPFFNVRSITVRRQDPRVDPEEVHRLLAPLFHQRLVLVTRSEVSSMLTTALPDIATVSIAKDYPSTLIVSVNMEPVIAELRFEGGDRKGAAGSGATADGAGPGAYAYLTKRGFFVRSPIHLTSGKLPLFTVTDWAREPENRSLLLRPAELKAIFLARDVLRRDFGLESRRTILYLRARELHLETPKVTLWFDLTIDLPVQFQKFRTFLKAVPLDQVKEYVDLRIADKIVYK